MIEFLIEAGSDLHATNERGETVFTFSASDPEADSLLRKYGGEAAEGAPTARPEPEEDSWAGLDVVKDQLWSLLSQPRVVRSGRSFDRTELLMALEQLGSGSPFVPSHSCCRSPASSSPRNSCRKRRTRCRRDSSTST
jgi:hypothetical protein